MRAKLDRMDEQLQANLQKLVEPPLLSPELDNARRQLAEAKVRERKISDLLAAQKERRERHMSRRPSGVMAGIRGETATWANGLAQIDARLTELKDKDTAAWNRRKNLEYVVAEIEKSLQRRKRDLRDSPEQQKDVLACRRKVERSIIARQILDKNPVVAFGGLTMLMAAATVAMAINNLLGEQFGTDPSRKFL
ncbi:MAG TPA: hypothetical protein VFC54_00600 [Pseudolabrys sp.]|nr:hypothetical protein [Pseudolabrys sp.]